VSNLRKLAIVGFVLFTLVLVGWSGLLWLSLNLLSFPCEEAHPGYSCDQSIMIEFAQQTALPLLLWVGAAFTLFGLKIPRAE
jgi:hypothetical protein